MSTRGRAFAALSIVVIVALLLAARALRRAPDVTLPTIRIGGVARAEGCLLCHASARGLGGAHAPSKVGCSTCHGGDSRSADRAAAHVGVDVLAGSLDLAMNTCGACHPVETARVLGSAMAGARGILAVDRFAFGERDDPTPRREDDLRSLRAQAPSTSPAEDHTRRLCASCHLARRKDAPGDHGFDARGGGCTACHLAPPDTRTATASTDGALHPDVSAVVSPSRCRGCHARSGRISLSYAGEVELDASDPRVVGRLPDGRPIGRASSDVHARAGMTCIDCHTERDLMGDGREHGFASESVGVTCDTCHAPTEHPVDADAAAVASRLRGARARRGVAPIPERAQPIVTEAGVPLWRTDRVSMTLWRAEDGVARAIPRRSDRPWHTLAGHARVECQACHTAWIPRCGGCHTSFDASGRDVDHLAGGPRPGAWREVATGNSFGPPVLLRNSLGRVSTFTEGMHLSIDGIARPVTRTLWAPLDPHTTGPSRPCASCHPAGALDATYPSVGEVTRPRARVLDASERARVAAVGRCVPCHGRYEDPVFRDFAASVRVAEARSRRPRDPHREASISPRPPR